MPRVARIVIPNCRHHVAQRGNNRQNVFFVDDDRRVYLELLREQAERFGLRVLGYCLMSNHTHLVAVPRRRESLPMAVGRTHWRYTQYVNRLHGRSGHLWQGRFHSAALDDMHLWTALRYVERNPVRARLTRRAWTYAWSSAAVHTGRAKGDPLIDLDWWRTESRGLDWKQILCEPEDEAAIIGLRRGTHTGRPLGSDRFVSKTLIRMFNLPATHQTSQPAPAIAPATPAQHHAPAAHPNAAPAPRGSTALAACRARADDSRRRTAALARVGGFPS